METKFTAHRNVEMQSSLGAIREINLAARSIPEQDFDRDNLALELLSVLEEAVAEHAQD